MENLSVLARPLGDIEVEWRTSRCGKGNRGVWAVLVPYVMKNTIMARLDAAFGPGAWSDHYHTWPVGGDRFAMVCEISGAGQTRSDGSDVGGADDRFNSPVKAAMTDAFKRAARKWGIGRELDDIGEVLVMGNSITMERPREKTGWIEIYSKRDQIRAWTRTPRLAGGQAPATQAAAPAPQQNEPEPPFGDDPQQEVF